MLHTELGHNIERQAAVAMDLDSLVDMDHQDIVSIVPGDPMLQVLHDQYCFMCGNGGTLMLCDGANCSRAICYGPDVQCLDLPVDSRFEDPDVLFICPACHQGSDRKADKPSPYYGFYVVRGPHPILDQSQTHTLPPGSNLVPLYESPAKIRGITQLIPRSKFLGNGVAILNFRLDGFHLDTGNLGKILEPFATAFFPKENNNLLIFEDIVYDLTRNQHKHEEKIYSIIRKLRAASSTLKTMIILITTHAEDRTGYLATSSSHHADINKWVIEVVTRPLLDIIGTLDTNWFFLCCGALVNISSSLHTVRSFANESKPANLFAFDAPSFHPIYATTFLLNFFQHIIIEGRAFESSAGQLLNTSSLARHTGIVRFWTRGSMVMDCTLRWSHSHARPWGKSVPFQCPYCYCIQAWDQSGRGASSELGRDVTMRCLYKGKQGQCLQCLTFLKPSQPVKPIKLSEGVWVAFGLGKSDFL